MPTIARGVRVAGSAGMFILSPDGRADARGWGSRAGQPAPCRSTEFEDGCGSDNPLLAEWAEWLIVAVRGSEVLQKRVSLPRLHLPHDDVAGKGVALFREYGLDQLACQLAQQADICGELCGEFGNFPHHRGVQLNHEGQWRVQVDELAEGTRVLDRGPLSEESLHAVAKRDQPFQVWHHFGIVG